MNKKLVLSVVAMFCLYISFAQNTPSYPKPKEGYKRVDLLFPKIENYDQYKVEVRYGIETELYPCSNASFRFMPELLIEEYGIKGGRFPYYDLTSYKASVTEGFKDDHCKKEQNVTRKILSSYPL